MYSTHYFAIANMAKAIISFVAKKARGIVGTKSVRSALAVKASLEQARSHSGKNAIEHRAAVADPLP